MKGYYISEGYMGLVGTKYVLFVNEEEYLEFVKEQNLKVR